MSEEEKLILPMKLSKESYDKVIIALYNSKAHEKAVNRSKIAEITDLDQNNISRAFSFLISIKVIQKEGNNVKLTEEGSNYARNIALNFVNESIAILNKLLRNNEIVQKIIGYLQVHKSIKNDELKRMIVKFSKKSIKSDYEKAAGTLVDMLLFSKILNEDNEVITLSLDELFIEDSLMEVKPQIIDKKPVTKIDEQEVVQYQINFNINTDRSLDTESITKMIKAVKKGIIESQE